VVNDQAAGEEEAGLFGMDIQQRHFGQAIQ